MDDVWPITANYELHQNLYDPDYSGTSFSWQPNLGDHYAGINPSFQGTLATIPAPATLGIGDPYWILQPDMFVLGPDTGYIVPELSTSTLADYGGYTNENTMYLQSGIKNLFGLDYGAAVVNEGGVDPSDLRRLLAHHTFSRGLRRIHQCGLVLM